MIYKNRTDAALKLIPRLEKYRNDHGVILAIPRGGIPIGCLIAKHYHFPLDLLLTKKIGHPLNEELAIGAVSLNDHIIDPRHDLPKSYIENEVIRIREILKKRYHDYMGNRKPVSLKNKTVIIVDDGIATGNTILSAIKVLRKKQPEKIVVAVPVAPMETIDKIKYYVDDFICPYIPDDFEGVGQFYEEFIQLDDLEIIKLLSLTDNLHYLNFQ